MVIFSMGATCRVVEQILTEGITIVDDMVGAVVFAFLGARAFLGAGQTFGPGAVVGVGAAVGGGGLDSSASSRASKASKCSDSWKRSSARVSMVA